jgi:hypothetical protein
VEKNQYDLCIEILRRLEKAGILKETLLEESLMARGDQLSRQWIVIQTLISSDPYRIWFFNGTFYLIGFCHARKEIRIFTLDRIKMFEVAGTEEIRTWIMSWGSKAEVIEPESLREEIQAIAEIMVKKYSSNKKMGNL